VQFLTRAESDDTRGLALAKSLLTLRPEAWRLRLASAHVQLARRQPTAALAELQQIDVHKPDDSRLSLVLADRASLGDINGASRDLQASRLRARPALLHYTEARIEWSRGRYDRARDLFDRAANEAGGENLVALELQSRHLAALARIARGEWSSATQALGASSARARGAQQTESAFLADALTAYVAHRSGDAEERDRKFLAASKWRVHPGYSAALYVVAIRLGSKVWEAWPRPDTANESELAGVDSLIDARVRWSRGDTAGAARSLQHARAEGVDTTGFREEAELLAKELGLPYTKLRPDPPYPNLLRLLAALEVGGS
jgi:tetratricopeptide (TPR) repeat protein